MNTYNNEIMKIEQSILSVLLMNDYLIKECELDYKEFNIPMHQTIYIAIKNVLEKYNVIDLALIQEECKGIGDMTTYIIDLMDAYVTSGSLHVYISKLREFNTTKEIEELTKQLRDKEIDLNKFAEEVRKLEINVTDTTDTNMLSSEEIIDLICTSNSELEFNKFAWLQDKVRFIERTVNIISARTSVGKSAFSLNLANDLADKYKVLYINMEMTEKELYQRLVSINANVPIEDFTNLSQEQKNRVINAVNKISKKKIKIYNGSKSVNGLRKIFNRECKKEHCIAFIDYVGYVTTGKNQNDRERIGEAVRQIQLMSKDYGVTVFLVAQINRDGQKAPTLTHLKDSGELEQTGHVVIMLHNPDKDISNQTPIYDIIIAKNRSGKKGKIKTLFDKNTQTFYKVERR